MSVAEKKPPTDTYEVRFYGPRDKADEAREKMRDLGFVEVTELVPADAVLPESNPGNNLAGLRYREGLTQQAISKLTGIPRRHISEMENGRRTIGKKRAQILADTLNADYRMLL
ncbi:MAG: helix-turn-helix transcriptional regulator [Desulfovermiculus sp.]|nr:helix-turn-helix transcriptional regulator [Desulfovermiculus sp.]